MTSIELRIADIQQQIIELLKPQRQTQLPPVPMGPNLSRGTADMWAYYQYQLRNGCANAKLLPPITTVQPLSREEKIARAELIAAHLLRNRSTAAATAVATATTATATATNRESQIKALQEQLMVLEEQYYDGLQN